MAGLEDDLFPDHALRNRGYLNEDDYQEWWEYQIALNSYRRDTPLAKRRPLKQYRNYQYAGHADLGLGWSTWVAIRSADIRGIVEDLAYDHTQRIPWHTPDRVEKYKGQIFRGPDTHELIATQPCGGVVYLWCRDWWRTAIYPPDMDPYHHNELVRLSQKFGKVAVYSSGEKAMVFSYLFYDNGELERWFYYHWNMEHSLDFDWPDKQAEASSERLNGSSWAEHARRRGVDPNAVEPLAPEDQAWCWTIDSVLASLTD